MPTSRNGKLPMLCVCKSQAKEQGAILYLLKNGCFFFFGDEVGNIVEGRGQSVDLKGRKRVCMFKLSGLHGRNKTKDKLEHPQQLSLAF